MPWLTTAWDRVRQNLAADRLAHALLVGGERGVGKRAFADALATLLVCERVSADSDGACGQCRQCLLVAGQSHPDVRVYAPEKSKMIRIDQVRALSAFAVASPQVARRKVVVVDRADQLNINSANALLKTLEEPSADTLLILLQENGRPILPTIRSRCQALGLPVPSPQQALQWLQAHDDGSHTHDQQALALRLAGGAPRLALEHLGSGFLAQRSEALEAFRQFLKAGVTVAAATKAFRPLGLEAVLGLMEIWAADMARIGAGGGPVDTEAGDMLRYLARQNPCWRAHELLDAIHEARAGLVNNVSPELEITRLLIAWRALMPSRRRARAP